jgi:hypothetical protein
MKPHQGILTGFKRLKDRSVNVNFNLNEISSEDFMEIDKQIDTFGVVYFSTKSIITDQEKEAIDSSTIDIGGKTQSERIRNVLYVLHSQTDTTESIESFYKRKTEDIIQHFKGKLI